VGLFDFMKKKCIRLICFDLDNTLYDYSSAEAEAEVHIAGIIKEKFSKDKLDQEVILRIFNEIKHHHMHHDLEPEKFSRSLWIREVIEHLGLKMTGKILDNYSKTLERKYWDFLTPKIQLFPDTLYTLNSLKISSRYKIACITDSDGAKEIKIDRIRALGLDKYFDFIITTDDTKKNKPSVENWEYLLKMSGQKVQECMMVGDHPEVDLLNAKKLGFVTVWSKEHIPTTIHIKYVDYEITGIGQLIGLLKRYN